MFLTALLWLALAQATSVTPQVPQAESAPAGYRVGPSDALAVSVIGVKEFAQVNKPWLDVVVSNSGKVHMPFIGAFNVNNMTVEELQEEVKRRFRDMGLMKDAQVTVRVMQYRAKTMYILGEIAQPGQYYMREDTYMMDLLGLSLGWPTEGIGYLYRRAPLKSGTDGTAGETSGSGETSAIPGETQVTEAIPIDFHALASGERPDLNLRLEGGDVLYVPFNRPKFFYATGDVENPGAFEIPPARDLLVTQAMSAAGGPTRTAKMSKGILVRFDGEGGRQELPVDFDAILRGRKPDFKIQENDIIFVPGSNAKTLGYGLLRIVPNLLLLP